MLKYKEYNKVLKIYLNKYKNAEVITSASLFLIEF